MQRRTRARCNGDEILKIAENRQHTKGLPDLLLYDSLVDDGILLLQDGALQAAWKFSGPDMASATHEEAARTRRT